LIDVDYTLPDAERMALGTRLDYRTSLDEVTDSERRLLIAENGLLPDLNARGNINLTDEAGRNQPLDFDWRTRRYSGGLDLELPLDRLNERNDYRRALISLERTRRDAIELRNNILVEVRRAYQDIEEARQTYEIQLISLALAQKRVDNVQMLMDAGREGITIRDQLEAQADLRDAQNDVTRSLVDYTIARLQFYNSIEALEIDERGMWDENDTQQL
jgi:outer membrane protein TolC